MYECVRVHVCMNVCVCVRACVLFSFYLTLMLTEGKNSSSGNLQNNLKLVAFCFIHNRILLQRNACRSRVKHLC